VISLVKRRYEKYMPEVLVGLSFIH